jgi:hypothetical protein
MKFADVRIPLTPRPVVTCLDLAVALCGQNAGIYLLLWAAHAIPAGGLVWWLSNVSSTWAWLGVVVIVGLATGSLGVFTIRATARMVFGESVSSRRAFLDAEHPVAGLWGKVLAGRLALFVAALVLLFPALLIGVRWGFWAESRLLRGLEGHRADRRGGELIQLEYGELLMRALGLLTAWFVAAAIFFITADCATKLATGQSIFLGRLSELSATMYYEADVFDTFPMYWKLLTTDPWVLATITACLLASYIPARVAWFLCYLDLRVRRDCWDVELAMIEDAARMNSRQVVTRPAVEQVAGR